MVYEIDYQGEPRRVVGNFGRNGFYYTHDAGTGQFLFAEAFTYVNWTAGLDPKTGLPVEYDPTKDIQTYAPGMNMLPGRPDTSQNVCPYFWGAPTYFPPTYDESRQRAWVVAGSGCLNQQMEAPIDREKDWVSGNPFGGGNGLWTWGLSNDPHGQIIGVDVTNGQKVQEKTVPYVLVSGLLGTAGGLLFTAHPDGEVAAYDMDTMEELWSFNVGSSMAAPPISYAIDGKQYIAVVAGGIGPVGLVFGPAPGLANVRLNAQLVVFSL